jgi:glycosyltransferase involved in cell wall biosynthesis
MNEPSPENTPNREGVSIVIPAFNEEAALGEDLDNIRQAMDADGRPYEIIVVDDGSADATAKIAEERPWVRLVSHVRNKGVGRSRMNGIEAAKYDLVVFTDADNTYPVKDIPRLLSHMDRYDMVVGARRTEAGTIKFLRRPAKWFLRKLAEYVTTFTIPDLNSGLRAFRRSMVRRFYHLLPERHSWVSTQTLAYLASNLDVKYVDIDYFPRKGQSTFHPIRDSGFFFLIIFRTIMYFKPMKVLLPVAGFVFFVLLVKVFLLNALTQTTGVYTPDIREFDLMLFMLGVILVVAAFFADMLAKFFRKF